MSFIPVSLPPTSAINDAYTKSQLQKWDLHRSMRFHVARYTKYYHRMQGAELVVDLLNDPKFQQEFKVLRKGGEWAPLPGQVAKADVTLVASSLTRLDLFDKLSEASPPIVRGNGDIARCLDDVREGFQISDTLREMLLVEESDNAELYSEAERDELLWRVFEHVVLGGSCCQFEDKIEPYVEVSKRLYKELVSAHKDAAGKVQVASVVYRVSGLALESGQGVELFPGHSRQNFMYVAVDPLRKLVKVWYHAFVPYW